MVSLGHNELGGSQGTARIEISASGAETRKFQDYKVISIVADALTPGGASSSAAMVMNTQCSQTSRRVS